MKLASGLAIVTGIIAIGSFAKKSYDNLWHNLKIAIPLQSVKVRAQIQTVSIDSSVLITNHYSRNFVLTKLHSTIFIKNKEGNLVEIGSTLPSVTELVLTKNKQSMIPSPTVVINSLTAVLGMKNVLTRPAGERIMIRSSMFINGIPFTTDVWY